MIKEKGLLDSIVLPAIKPNRNHIFHQYTIRLKQDVRDQLVKFLKENDIGSEVYYPVPLHLQECFQYLGYKTGDLPVAEESALRVLSLPMYPELSDENQCYVVDKIGDFFGNKPFSFCR